MASSPYYYKGGFNSSQVVWKHQKYFRSFLCLPFQFLIGSLEANYFADALPTIVGFNSSQVVWKRNTSEKRTYNASVSIPHRQSGSGILASAIKEAYEFQFLIGSLEAVAQDQNWGDFSFSFNSSQVVWKHADQAPPSFFLYSFNSSQVVWKRHDVAGVR